MARDTSRFRMLLGWTLVLYWIALFVVTHLPPKLMMHVVDGWDKVQHFAAYAGLGAIFATWLCLRRGFDRRSCLVAWGIIVLYGALDELSQIWVGRNCEFLDLLADALGAATGIALAAWVAARYRDRPGSD